MKKSMIMVAFAMCMGSAAFAQGNAADSTGLPGDNFSLAGALDLFKKSSSPEEFEKMLNSEDQKVNNLDLNGDGEIDYIKVIDKQDGDDHAFILQDAVSENENQDVAVVEVEKHGNNDASVQIVGDKDLYGEEMVYEPKSDARPMNAGTTSGTSVVNVYNWPAVQYVYTPSYRLWVSPWGWRARPVWYRPWRPVAYRVFYPYRAPYRHSYAVVYAPRAVRIHNVYTPARVTSVTVQRRNAAAVTSYRATKTTKTTVNPANGNVTRRTTVRGPRGHVRSRTTRVKKVK